MCRGTQRIYAIDFTIGTCKHSYFCFRSSVVVGPINIQITLVFIVRLENRYVNEYAAH